MLDTRVRDWSTDSRGPAVETSYRSLWLSFSLFFAVAGLVWIALFSATRVFPFVQNGAEAVGKVKWTAAAARPLFSPDERVRVLAFGNSKTLAGFHPEVFETAFGPGVASYNLAIPGESRFVDLLEAALKEGSIPTHVLVQLLPQTDPSSTSLWALLLDNKRMVNLLFPFRGFVRDAIIFLSESRKGGGIVAQYDSNALQIQHLKEQRGYYFIKSQSHFPGDRLPEGYALPTDRPDEVLRRDADGADPNFELLMKLADKYGFEVVLVPAAFRLGEAAAPPPVDPAATRLEALYPRFHVLGPVYWLYDVKYFSDPVHLNPEGADRYSRELAAAFKTFAGTDR